MSAQCPPRRAPRSAHQRGQAMLLTVLLLGVGVSAVVYNFVTPAKQSIAREKITAAALSQAKEALIGFALSVDITQACGDPSNCPRIGDLPCPDLDNDGDAEGNCGAADGSTGQAQRLGRLPWKTLGLPDLRDGYGERLWYAVSSNFKNNTRTDCSSAGLPSCRNSDIRGTITVRERSGSAIHDGANPDPFVPSGAIAVILASGPVIQRSDGTQQDRSAAGQNNPVNYLDLANVGGNEDNANFQDSTTNGFIGGDVLDANGRMIVNDRVITIRYEDMMPLMERRVAKEVLNCLNSYAAASHDRYPWAARIDLSATGDYSGQQNVRFGRVPESFDATLLGLIPPVGLLADVVNLVCGIPLTAGLCMRGSWPNSLANPPCNFAAGTWWKNWKESVFYGIAADYSPSVNVNLLLVTLAVPTPGGCGACLTVNPPSATANKQIVVMVAGKRLSAVSGGQPRGTLAQKSLAANYVEGENNWSTTSTDIFIQQGSTGTFNDAVLYRQ